MMATILYPDGRHEEVEPANGTDFKLDELRHIVGGNIEIVPLKDGRIMVCNEESKLLDRPRNDQATELAGLPSAAERARLIATYRAMGIDVIEAFDPNEEDYIAGTVLVCEDHEVR